MNPWPWLMNGGGAIAETVHPLSTDRRIFLAGGQPWRWKGVSAFPLCDRFAHGEDIDAFLEAFARFNLLRVWDYVTWPDTGWESNTPDVWLAFLEHVGARGFYVELTLLTDDDFTRIEPAKVLVREFAAGQPSNLVIEIGNEPRTHKHIDVAALRATCEASGFLFASGNNNVDEPWFGSYLTAHTPRDSEWPRKAHDLLEYYDGGGPGAPSDPAHHVPCVGDEPIRPDEATPAPGQPRSQYGVPLTDARAHYGALSLLGGGGTVHCECGKYGTLPQPYEREWIAAALEGLDAFPAAEPNNGYRRIDEHGATSRTYVVGNSMVRIRPTTKTAPEPGWTPIDPDGILWRR